MSFRTLRPVLKGIGAPSIPSLGSPAQRLSPSRHSASGSVRAELRPAWLRGELVLRVLWCSCWLLGVLVTCFSLLWHAGVRRVSFFIHKCDCNVLLSGEKSESHNSIMGPGRENSTDLQNPSGQESPWVHTPYQAQPDSRCSPLLPALQLRAKPETFPQTRELPELLVHSLEDTRVACVQTRDPGRVLMTWTNE